MSANRVFTHTLVTGSPEETIAAGKMLGGMLLSGDVVGLTGELGSGKTVLTKGIAAGLGFTDSDRVTSPTYKILNRYEGKVIINHFDTYRLEGPEDFADTGGEDMLGGSGVCIIEWAERIEAVLPQGTVRINMTVLSESERKIEFVYQEDKKEIKTIQARTV